MWSSKPIKKNIYLFISPQLLQVGRMAAKVKRFFLIMVIWRYKIQDGSTVRLWIFVFSDTGLRGKEKVTGILASAQDGRHYTPIAIRTHSWVTIECVGCYISLTANDNCCCSLLISERVQLQTKLCEAMSQSVCSLRNRDPEACVQENRVAPKVVKRESFFDKHFFFLGLDEWSTWFHGSPSFDLRRRCFLHDSLTDSTIIRFPRSNRLARNQSTSVVSRTTIWIRKKI